MGNIFSFGFENQLIIFLQKYMSPLLTAAAGLITEFGDELALVVLIGLVYWSLNKELGKKIIIYLSFVNIVNPCIKSVVRRLRPYMADGNIRCLKPVNKEGDIYDIVTQEYSFPSGHAANSIAAYGTVAKNVYRRWLRALLYALCLLIGISRFALGVHYPTDVLAGWLISCLCIALYHKTEEKIGRYRTYLLFDILGLAGFFVAKTNDFYTGYGMLLGATAGIVFEEKHVNFETARGAADCIARTLIGGGLFLGLNALLKLPFDSEFLTGGTTAAFAVRAARYALLMFLLLGVYPAAFKYFGGKYGKNTVV